MTDLTAAPIALTGASGFIASWIAAELLERGATVHATVRRDADSYPFLTGLPGADERLKLFKADLLDEGSFDAAFAGCDAVIHTASPYIINVSDAQTELVDPALLGTRHALESAARAGVKTLVLTSSVAAICDEPEAGHVYTEEDWNRCSSVTRNPYYYSKTVAEQAAHDFLKEREPGFELVVINPYMVIGPSLTPSLNTSNGIFRDLLQGVYPVKMNLAWGFVDVRDVAHAHVLGLTAPGASGRYLCAAETLTLHELVALLRESISGPHKLPGIDLSGPFGTALMRVAALFQPAGTRSFLRTHLGRRLDFDNRRIREQLGLEFRPVRETIIETVQDLAHHGHIDAAFGA